MALDQLDDARLRAANVVLGLERIERLGRQQLAGGIDHGGLDAGADARIQPQRRLGPGGGGQQQVLEIAGENGDRLFMRALTQFAQQVEVHRQAQLDPPCPARRVAQPGVARPVACHADLGGHHGDRAVGPRLRVGRDLDRHDLFLRGAQDGQRPVRGDIAPFLAVVEVVRELGPGLFLAGDHLGANEGFGPHEIAQFAQQSGLFRQPLGEDVARALQRRLGRRHGLGDESLGQRLRCL